MRFIDAIRAGEILRAICRTETWKIGLASGMLLLFLLNSSYSMAGSAPSDSQKSDFHKTDYQKPPAIITETADNLPGYNIYRPADMSASGRKLPVITWANGGCVRHDRTWKSVFERWAAEGYFVVTITRSSDAVDVKTAAREGRSTPDDQAAAIDWAVKENSSATSPYAGFLDTERVVAAGNSCGGITSLALAGKDSRVKSVFVLSGSSVGPGAKPEEAAAIMEKVSVPVGFVVGGAEDIASDQADQDYDLLGDGLAGMVVKRVSGDHRTVSTDPNMLRDAVDIAVNWINATLYGDKAAIKTLAAKACSTCEAGVWTVKTKNL